MKAHELVGAGRWPCSHLDPRMWKQPLQGRVLPIDSPIAWACSCAFPTQSPAPDAVLSHVLRLQQQGIFEDRVPVLWQLEGGSSFVTWETLVNVRPWSEELRYWAAVRAQRLDQLEHPRRKTKLPLDHFLKLADKACVNQTTTTV